MLNTENKVNNEATIYDDLPQKNYEKILEALNAELKRINDIADEIYSNYFKNEKTTNANKILNRLSLVVENNSICS